MTTVLAILGGSTTLAALAAIIWLAVKLAARDSDLIASMKLYRDQMGVTAEVQKQRDDLQGKFDVTAAQLVRAKVALTDVTEQRDRLAKENAALRVRVVGTLPVGDEGAAAVNDEFSNPLPLMPRAPT